MQAWRCAPSAASPATDAGHDDPSEPAPAKAGDASTHRWYGEGYADLVVTLDDATSEITSAFFCKQEGTNSSLRGIHETISKHGLFCSFYTDRGSHYFYTPEVGGKVDKSRLTPFFNGAGSGWPCAQAVRD